MQQERDNKISKNSINEILKGYAQMSANTSKARDQKVLVHESGETRKETQNASRPHQKATRSVPAKEPEAVAGEGFAGARKAPGAEREETPRANHVANAKTAKERPAATGEQATSISRKDGGPGREPEREADKKATERSENLSVAVVPYDRAKSKEDEKKAEPLKPVRGVVERREDNQNPSRRRIYFDRGSIKESLMEELADSRLVKAMAGNTNKARLLDSFRGSSAKEQEKICESAITPKSARSAELRDLVVQAIKDHKIFCIFSNHWYIVRPVREELLSRGWLEVIPDRKLIPRRRPPPAGPTTDRNGTTDSAIEAILTAREAFADEITEPVSKILPSKLSLDKSSKTSRKPSDESVKDAGSEFQIVPPTPEKKKNNVDIREFVSKCKDSGDPSKDCRNLLERERQRCRKVRGRAVSRSVCGSEGVQAPEKGEKAKTEGTPGIAPPAIPSSVKEPSLGGSRGKGDETVAYPPQPNAASGTPEEKKGSTGKEDPKEASKISKFMLTEGESKVVSKMIQSLNARIHFMWLSIKPAMHLKCFNYSPEIVNKFQKTTFCTKIGLWSHLNNIQWCAPEVHFPAKSPRMYNTGEADDLEAFFQDFQMTACIGMLKWLSETFFDKGFKGVQKKKGKVPIKAFEFAIRQCERYMRFRENEDLGAPDEPKVLQEEWDAFLQWFYVITNDHGKVQETSNSQLMVVYTKAVEILRAMKRYWPEIDVDGRLNIWIMKPYCASCGRGIFMTNNMFYIAQHSKYIVQKYIERPFLIYNTKFDIRQWFLITKLIPLEIWMYKECYLRFCTQPFVLRNLHESVHLSNNSVQRKYVSQDPSLADQNMWDSNTFQQYLKTIGQPNAWGDVIYPGMRDAIISIMLAAQDTFDSQRKSWFEIYGADFMISANLTDGPWLIEINENPAMDPSTKVTSRLCPQMLRDVIKVVVDKRSNKNALTGQWELVYRQNYSPCFGTVDVDVKGKKIAKASPAARANYYSSLRSPIFFSCVNAGSKREDERRQCEVGKGCNAERTGTNESVFESQKRTNQSSVKPLAKPGLAKEANNPWVGKSKKA